MKIFYGQTKICVQDNSFLTKSYPPKSTRGVDGREKTESNEGDRLSVLQDSKVNEKTLR